MPASDYKPTIEQIGALLYERTADSVGNKLGTFTETTRPTATNVSSIIERAVGTVSSTVGNEIPESCWEMARSLVALRAAMLIEVSFFPEQIRADKSPFESYRKMYEFDLADLRKAVAEAGSGEEPGSADNMAEVEYAYPEDNGGLVGWDTEW